MMKKGNKKIMALILLILILISNFNLSFAVPKTIYIDSPEDLVALSKNASLDTYYKDKTVIMRSDIDMSARKDFKIPTFGGTFDGQGHTISGIIISAKGSNQGLFRYLQEDGVIKNLTVSGKVMPSGSRNVVGGLVGNNRGRIEHCRFDGSVEGVNNVGGLVGINEATGTISNCIAEGKVTGDHFTGGLVGQNLGTILKATNLSKVNSALSEVAVNVENVNWSQINAMENVSARTDTGGIAGFSSGYLQDCTNKGLVGYKYIGYNVGGIVGRQSGYLNNCQNYNTVLGRKDVGGIVGQIEPHLVLLFSEDSLQKLNKELNVLENTMKAAYRNGDVYSKTIWDQVSNIGASVDDTRDRIQILSKGTTDYVDELTDTVNITSRRIRYTLEESLPILEEAEAFWIACKEGLDDLESAFDHLDLTSDQMAATMEEGQYGIKKLGDAVLAGEEALGKIEKAFKKLLENLEDKNKIAYSMKELEESVGQLGDSFKDGASAVGDIYETVEHLKEEEPGFGDWLPELGQLKDSLEKIDKVLSNLSKAFGEFNGDLDGIFASLKTISRRLDESFVSLQETFRKLEVTSRESGKAFNSFSKGFKKFEQASQTMADLSSSIKDLVDVLVSEPNIELPNISSDYRQSGDDLFTGLENMSLQIHDLNKALKNVKNNFVGDVEAVSDQVMVIFNLLIDSRQELGQSKYIEDISDESIETAQQGIVYKNQNYGFIGGSVNIGGIVGAMAVEYDLDPEDDVFEKGNPSLNFQYLTTAIVKDCVNHGKVTAKKDYTGGIVGRMDLGIVTGCESYGDVKSKEGNYAGGIAGASYSNIDGSFALLSIEGKDYVGGIAGYGNNISNSYSLVEIIKGEECIGAIAGQAIGELDGNYYVHESVGAIDGISYQDQASALKYEDLLEVKGLPKAFTSFDITFIADGTIVERVPFNYGDSFDLKALPGLPSKEGYDGRWESFGSLNMAFNKTVEAIYTPLRSVLSSKFVREGESLPLFLAEGKFNEEVELRVSAYDLEADPFQIKHHQIVEAWDIELEGLDNEGGVTRLRLLLPDKKDKVKIWKQSHGSWEKVDASINGSYVTFDMEGVSGAFCLTNKGPDFLGPIALFVTIIILIIFFKPLQKVQKIYCKTICFNI